MLRFAPVWRERPGSLAHPGGRHRHPRAQGLRSLLYISKHGRWLRENHHLEEKLYWKSEGQYIELWDALTHEFAMEP